MSSPRQIDVAYTNARDAETAIGAAPPRGLKPAALLRRPPSSLPAHARLSHVKRLLRETDFLLPTVARHTGFKAYDHMSKVFHKHVGQTPGQYRRGT